MFRSLSRYFFPCWLVSLIANIGPYNQRVDTFCGSGHCQANNARLSSTINTLQVESKLLKRRNELLQDDVDQAKRTEQEMRDRVEVLRKDKQDLMERLAAVEKKTTDLSKQAKALVEKAHQRRLEIVSLAFGKTSFIEESFVPTRVVFNDLAQIMSALPSDLTQSLQYEPSCLDSYLWKAQSFLVYTPFLCPPGYRFHPPITIPKGTPVELVVEAKPHEQLYLGRYLSAPLDGEDMKVSEWIKLDTQTKKAYCTAVGQTLKEQKPDQQVSCAKIQRQLDSGEYAAPCYRLQCVGYDLALQEAFVKASTSQLLDIDASRPSQNILLSMKVVVKSFHAMWRVGADLGQSHSIFTEKRSHLDDDEASVTKRVRVDGLPAGRRAFTIKT
ncbi:hypothetical protein EDD85DRAFT_958777 [Armillaria nabsnona]|nr:hypothetical protein EDD85DRAFT_958777 [Armillaria nabsnona]